MKIHYTEVLTRREGLVLFRARSICGTQRGYDGDDDLFTKNFEKVTCKSCLKSIKKQENKLTTHGSVV